MPFSYWNLQIRSKKTGNESNMVTFPNYDGDVKKVHKFANDYLYRNRQRISPKAVITLEEKDEYGIITIIPLQNPSIYAKENI